MSSSVFLQDLAVVLLAAGFAAVLCHRLQQPKMLGYILVGLLLGPHTPPFSFIRDETVIRTLAELGVIFLMVSLGLEFNLRRFRRVGAQAGFSAVLDVGVMIWLGYMAGRQLGWSPVESLFLGGIVCDSSTTILAKSLQDTGRSRAPFAGYIIGVTVVEDVLAVAVIAVLTGLAVTGAVDAGLVAGSLWAMVLFLASVIVVGLLILPRLLDHLARFENDELLVVPLVGLCFGVAIVASRLGLSTALGAVLVGAIASESRAVQRSAALIDPLRHVFSAVFFVAIGLMLDPAMLLRHGGPILLVAGIVVAGKLTTNTIGALLTGHDMPSAIRSGAGLAQIGEFAFIIAALGLSLGAMRDPVYQVGVAAAILTTLMNPYLMRAADRLAGVVDRSPRCRRWTIGFHLYGEWARRIRNSPQNNIIRRAIRRSLVTILVNIVLISAAIACAGYLARQPQILVPALSAFPRLVPAVCWLAAMLVCLPLYVAIIRKLGAVGMILAEIGLPMALTSSWARHMRGFVANAILTAGSVALVLLTFVLSSAMLPSREVLVLLMAVTIAIGLWSRPRLIRVYAQAQSAVESVFSADASAVPPGPEISASVDTDLRDLNVRGVALSERSPVAGLSLRAIGLRTRTGATVVGIRRDNRQLVNPGPDEILTAGDRIFFLGTASQVRAARTLLGGHGGARPPA